MRHLFLACVLFATEGYAQTHQAVAQQSQAQFNYMLNCQGCHGPHGEGTADAAVPAMQNFVGHFLRVEGGRQFLVRVPGTANAALDNEQLAQLLNWMLVTMSSAQLPEIFAPYSSDEVAEYRSHPIVDVARHRAKLIASLEELGVFEH